MVENKKPIKNYKAGTLTLSMWENESENGKLTSFTIQRSYKDKEDNWQHTSNLRTQDLPKLQILIQKAYQEQILTIN